MLCRKHSIQAENGQIVLNGQAIMKDWNKFNNHQIFDAKQLFFRK